MRRPSYIFRQAPARGRLHIFRTDQFDGHRDFTLCGRDGTMYGNGGDQDLDFGDFPKDIQDWGEVCCTCLTCYQKAGWFLLGEIARMDNL